MQVTFIFAFVAVLALMLLAAWLIRRFANSRLGTNTNRGRMPRLAVIDAAAVDGRRRLVLVRRDNIEHLLMIGGPTDIVVEANIVRAQARSEQFPQRPPAAEPPPRIAPLPDAAVWADGDGARIDAFDQHLETQMPEPPPRPSRPPFADEVRRQAPVPPERRGERTTDPLTGFAPEPLAPRPEPRPEPITPRLPRTEPMIARASRQAEPKAPPVVRAAPMAPAPGGALRRQKEAGRAAAAARAFAVRDVGQGHRYARRRHRPRRRRPEVARFAAAARRQADAAGTVPTVPARGRYSLPRRCRWARRSSGDARCYPAAPAPDAVFRRRLRHR